MYAKDLSEPKNEFLIKRYEDAGTKQLNDPDASIECSNTMDDIYENVDDYSPNKKRKILIVFDDMIADIVTNQKFQVRIKELFISDCNWTRTQNQLVLKRTLNHLAKLAQMIEL